MGIDEQIKKESERRKRKTVIGIRVNDRELESIDQKVKEIGNGRWKNKGNTTISFCCTERQSG